jgi:hypothetical protein
VAPARGSEALIRGSDRRHLPSRRGGDRRWLPGPRAELAERFVLLGNGLLDDFDDLDVREPLDRLARAGVDVLAATASGVMLVEPQGVGVVAASDERSEMLELFQVQRNEGPCLECVRSGAPVLVTDLDAQVDRWPAFAPKALGLGFRSVNAFPLKLRSEVIGGLNLFHSTTAPLDDEDVRVAQALADVATINVLHGRELGRSREVAQQLQRALDSRIVLEQAKGMLAEFTGTGMDEAFRLLRRYCRDHNLRLHDTARRLTERTLPLSSVGTGAGTSIDERVDKGVDTEGRRHG